MLTEGEIALLLLARFEARLKRKAINRRRYLRRYARIKAARAKGRA